jgi:dihydrofolate synthase / folylpolyglutamate synthase
LPATQIAPSPTWPGEITAPLDYEQALAYLFHAARYDGHGLKYQQPERSLDRMRQLLAAMGNPQERFRCLHITGTKGKGSTSAMCESILRNFGHATGLFTSPHLHTFRERMRVNGELIGRQDLAELMRRLRAIFESIPDLTVFDQITALALQHFADRGVEWAVVEVGLGGRLDSTNVIRPAVCGITRVSLDHTHVLGDTIEEIAWEKAGIIKTGVPVFTGAQQPGVLEVFQDVARRCRAPLTVVAPGGGSLPLIGVHQQINAAIATAMVGELARQGLVVHDPDAVAEGIRRTWWPGRLEQLPTPVGAQVPLLVDCAHNVDSVEMLINTLATDFPGRPITFIVGVNRDKQIAPMLKSLLQSSSRLVLVQSRHPKALSPSAILDEVCTLLAQDRDSPGVSTIQAAESMGHAIELATGMSPPGGLLVGTGSVFVVAELREAWMYRYPDIFPAWDWVYEAPAEPVLA